MSAVPQTDEASKAELKGLIPSSSDSDTEEESYTSFSDEEHTPLEKDPFSERTSSLAEVSDMDTTPVESRSGTDTEGSSGRESGTPEPSEQKVPGLSPVAEEVPVRVHPGRKQRQKRGFLGRTQVTHENSANVFIVDADSRGADSIDSGADGDAEFGPANGVLLSEDDQMDLGVHSSLRFEEEDPAVVEELFQRGIELYKGDRKKKKHKNRKRRRKHRKRMGSKKRQSTGVRSVDSSVMVTVTEDPSSSSSVIKKRNNETKADVADAGCFCRGPWWFTGWFEPTAYGGTVDSSSSSPKKRSPSKSGRKV